MTDSAEGTAGTAADSTASAMPVAKRWNVDVLETSKRVVVVESFTRSEAKQRAKNAAFWVEKGEATEVVKSTPKGTPRELDGEGKEVPAKPKAEAKKPAGSK